MRELTFANLGVILNKLPLMVTLAAPCRVVSQFPALFFSVARTREKLCRKTLTLTLTLTPPSVRAWFCVQMSEGVSSGLSSPCGHSSIAINCVLTCLQLVDTSSVPIRHTLRGPHAHNNSELFGGAEVAAIKFYPLLLF